MIKIAKPDRLRSGLIKSVLFRCCWIKKSFNAKLKIKKIEKNLAPLQLRGSGAPVKILTIF